jgi:hypothetical protein
LAGTEPWLRVIVGDAETPICVRLTRLVADVLRSFSGAA